MRIAESFWIFGWGGGGNGWVDERWERWCVFKYGLGVLDEELGKDQGRNGPDLVGDGGLGLGGWGTWRKMALHGGGGWVTGQWAKT